MEQIREILSQGPSQNVWKQLCLFLEAADVSEGGEEQWQLDYVAEHIADWPEELRVAPFHWVEACIEEEPPPFWTLARVARIEQANATTIRQICKSPAFESIKGLAFYDCKLGPQSGVKALCQSPYIKDIKYLTLHKCLLTDEGMEQLMASDLVTELEQLTLEFNHHIRPKKHVQTERSIQAIADATHMGPLKKLVIRSEMEAIRSWRNDVEITKAFRDLGRQSHTQTLESLAIGYRYGAEINAFFDVFSGTSLTSLDLRSCGFGEEGLATLLAFPIMSAVRHFGISTPLCGEAPSEDAFALFCTTQKLQAMNRLELEVYNEDLTPLTTAPWTPQIKELIIHGEIEPDTRKMLIEAGLFKTNEDAPVRPTRTAAEQCTTISFEIGGWDDEKTAEHLDKWATFAENDARMCGELHLDVHSEYIPAEQVEALLASPLLVNLRKLRVEFAGWEWTKEDRYERCLRAIAMNPVLAGLEILELRGLDFQTSFRGWLDIQLSPYLPVSIRQELSLHSLYSSQFKGVFNNAQTLSVLYESPRLAEMEELDCSKLELCDGGVQAIVGCEYLSQLKTLRLASCQIGNEGAQYIANSPYLRELTTLDLKYNRGIDQTGFRVLAESGTLSPSITKAWKKKVK
jgi:hypothetical protein